jgi:hypothetical protein
MNAEIAMLNNCKRGRINGEKQPFTIKTFFRFPVFQFINNDFEAFRREKSLILNHP